MQTELVEITAVKPNPANPRIIRDEKFAQLVRSVRDFPKMLDKAHVIEFETENMAIVGRGVNGSRGARFCNCQSCGTWFLGKKHTKNRTPKYCSRKCFGKSIVIAKECLLCKKEIKVNGTSKHTRVYCSKSCQSESRRGVRLPDEWRRNLSVAHVNSTKNKGANAYNWKGGAETLKVRMKSSYYRRKKSLVLEIDHQYLGKVLIAQNNKCFFCDRQLSEYKAIEHLTPVSRGGDNDNFNLVYSCKSCNSKKRQLTLEEFAIRERRFDWIDKFDFVYASSAH